MATVTGTVQGQPGEVPDYSHNELGDSATGVINFSPYTFLYPGNVKNTGNVDQTYEVNAVNLSPNVNSVTFDVGGTGTNTVTLSPNEAKTVQVTVDVDIPATPAPTEPAVEESFSFDLEQNWT